MTVRKTDINYIKDKSHHFMDYGKTKDFEEVPFWLSPKIS